MEYEAKAWQEAEGPCLRGFDEAEALSSVNGALALRPQIEAIIDKIWEEGFSTKGPGRGLGLGGYQRILAGWPNAVSSAGWEDGTFCQELTISEVRP